jgi:uroporphyrinogen-III synthase/uroporphyrinogen III methyltransferase/synthase
MTALPLAGRRVLEGKRILVTRAAHQAGKLSEGLRALGAEPVEVPVLEVQPPADLAPLDGALRSLDSYDWLILTSANTVRSLQERAQSLGLPLSPGPHLQVAAVGEATAAAARKAGLSVTLVPENYVAESLVEAVLHRAYEVSGHDFSRAKNANHMRGALAPAGNFRGQRFLIARAEIARDVIPDALRAAGATVDVVDAYRNVMPAATPELLRAALEKGIDAATFTSSSSATHLADAARAAGIAFPIAGVHAVSIGPITSQTLRNLGWEPAAEANLSDMPGLIAAVQYFLSPEP